MLFSLVVGLGEFKTSRDPNAVLVAYGLGSCVGIGLYDPEAQVAGLLHAILPAPPEGMADPSPKYVMGGIAALLEQMEQAGADRSRLIVRMAGGANMLAAPGVPQALNIGSRNLEAAYKALADLNLKIAGQDVGGNLGRTVRFYVADGRMTIRAIGYPEREI